jgi:hypothetical protein
MPKPPILPIINWKAVFEYARDYETWLRNAENPENADKIERSRKELRLEAEEEEFLRTLPRQVNVLAIAEDWCGDVVRHVPVLQALADHGPRMQVRYISRDYPDILIRFLTNGGESIPKFIFLNELFAECGHWGPMPYGCRDVISRGKAAGDMPGARKVVSTIYESDPQCRDVVRELLHLIEIASSREVIAQFRWSPYIEMAGMM